MSSQKPIVSNRLEFAYDVNKLKNAQRDVRFIIDLIHANMPKKDEEQIRQKIMEYIQTLHELSPNELKEISEINRSPTNYSKDEYYNLDNKFNNSIIIEEEHLANQNQSALSMRNQERQL